MPKSDLHINSESRFFQWLRGKDLNLRPSGYEPDELPYCSTPRYVAISRIFCFSHLLQLLVHVAVSRVAFQLLMLHFLSTYLLFAWRRMNWCRRPESNRYDRFGPQDFKSCASASSATPARFVHLSDFISIIYIKMHVNFFKTALTSCIRRCLFWIRSPFSGHEFSLRCPS